MLHKYIMVPFPDYHFDTSYVLLLFDRYLASLYIVHKFVNSFKIYLYIHLYSFTQCYIMKGFYLQRISFKMYSLLAHQFTPCLKFLKILEAAKYRRLGNSICNLKGNGCNKVHLYRSVWSQFTCIFQFFFIFTTKDVNFVKKSVIS